MVVVLNSYDPVSHMPEFGPAVCVHCSCTIRGAHFRCLTNCNQINCGQAECLQPYCRQPDQRPPSHEPLAFCETCTRANVHPAEHLRKLEKRCILREVVPPTRCRQICTCEDRTAHTSDGDEDQHFAVDGGYPHEEGCPVLGLKRCHEWARLQELRHAKACSQAQKDGQGLGPGRGTERNVGWAKRTASKSVGSAAQVVTPPIPFGDRHMVLMVGPILIENGVEE